MILNYASNITFGNKQVKYIYLGNKQVWPTRVTPPALSATIISGSGSWGVSLDTSKNVLYVADNPNAKLQKVFLSNNSYIIAAGTGVGGYSGDGGLAINAKIAAPFGFAVDANNNIYFSDSGNQRIRKIDTNGIITTIAGTGTGGYNGDNILATTARIYASRGLDFDASGNLYFADTFNQRIRKIDKNGIITTVAGTGTKSFTGDGNLATSATFNNPSDVKVDINGNLYIADTGNGRVRKVDTSGIITTIIGNGTTIVKDNVSLTATGQNQPYCLAFGAAAPGSNPPLYITNYLANCVYYANLNTQIGSIYAGYVGPNNWRLTNLDHPVGVAIDNFNTVYVGDSYNNRVVGLYTI